MFIYLFSQYFEKNFASKEINRDIKVKLRIFMMERDDEIIEEIET